jgi:hypothetical protein
MAQRFSKAKGLHAGFLSLRLSVQRSLQKGKQERIFQSIKILQAFKILDSVRPFTLHPAP